MVRVVGRLEVGALVLVEDVLFLRNQKKTQGGLKGAIGILGF